MPSKLAPAVLTLAALAVAPATARADIIVQRVAGATGSEVRTDAGVRLVQRLPIARTEVVKAAPGDQAAALRELDADPDVAYAEPDGAVHALTDDFFFGSQWALANDGTAFGGVAGDDIRAPDAWALSRGAGETVAVVDTGVERDHEDLDGQVADPGWDWVGDDDDPSDEDGHGTHVAGIVAAAGDNELGISGVAPEAKILPLRVLDDHGSGTMADTAAAFAYASEHGARIVNASLGGAYSEAVEDAIAAHPNTLYVVAAGNSAADDDVPAHAFYPCALPLANVICVGASDESDQPAGFSSYGAQSVDLYAPGVDIVSTYLHGGYALLDGTSMAAPHVAGAAALALAANPEASTAQLRAALLGTVDQRPALAGLSVTGGRLNAAAAVAELAGVTPEPQAAAPAPIPEPPPAPTPAPPVATPEPPAVTPTPALPPVQPVTEPILGRLRLHGSLRSRLRVSFTVSSAATVRFTVLRHGRSTGSWTRRARGGTNVYRLRRRLPTHRTLRPGAYTLRVSLGTSAATARFRVRR